MSAEQSDSFLARAIRAARLDPAVYEEVAADPRATGQAMLLVMTVGVLGSLGAAPAGAGAVIASAMLAPLAWVLTAGLAHLVGKRVIGASSSTFEAMARALGFAHVPATFGVLSLIPQIGLGIVLILIVWRIAAMLIAIRAALGVTIGQAAMTLALSTVTLLAATFTITAIATGGAVPAPAD